MRIRTIALANLRRRKGKAAFLVIGMAIGIGTAVALYSLSHSIKEEIGLQLDQFGANIVIVPQSNSLALDYGGITVAGVSYDVHQLKTEDATRIMDIPYGNRLSVVAPKLLGAVKLGGRDVLIAGVDFESELRLKRWWHVVGETPAAAQDVLVGYELAKALSLVEATGGPMTSHEGHDMKDMENMPEQARVIPAANFRIVQPEVALGGRQHRVAGVLAPTGGREDAMMFGSLAEVQSLLGKPGEVSLIEVSALCQNCPVEDIVAQISERLPNAKVSAIQQSVRARTETVERLTRFSAAVSAVVLAVGSLMIFTTMMGSVVERTKEIGVMRAVGFRRTHIIKELMIEVAAVSALGGLIGWGAGMLASWLALPYFAETSLGMELSPVLALIAMAAALGIGALSSLYPAIRASKLDPAESVRYV
jgi:putative ABC transport system permease protein